MGCVDITSEGGLDVAGVSTAAGRASAPTSGTSVWVLGVSVSSSVEVSGRGGS